VSRGKRRRAAGAPATAGPRPWRVVAALAIAGLALVLAWVAGRPTSPPAAARPSAVSTAAPSPSEFGALVGEWVRPDGGYVLALKAVAPDGTATASYFNPRPIHVARAEARREGGLLGLFVELRDVNYPGSTYTLVHDSTTDQLKGVYFQAQQQAQYEVFFSRRR